MSDDPMDIIREGLGSYPLTPLVAEAIKFYLKNRFESLVVVNQKAEIEYMDGITEEFYNLLPGDARGKKISEILPLSLSPDILRTGGHYVDKLLRTKGGYLLNSRFPLVRDGKLIGAIGKVKSTSFEEIERLRKEVEKYKSNLLSAQKRIKSEYQATYTFDDIIGVSEKISQQKEVAKKMARTNSDILIFGESGTGKELFAHAIHNESKQKSSPFIKVNCPAIPIEIAESELFGYEKGAFTGARQEGKPGKFELAEGGTIFLDEIGSLSLSVQAKLLRVIQEREVERLGGKKPIKVNFRLITATNVDLKKLAEEGKFRFDMIFRLSKAVLFLPPLRERKEDIPIYVSHFINILNKNFDASIQATSDEVLNAFRRYSWPGNVRELANSLEQSFYNMGYDDVLRPNHLPDELTKNATQASPSYDKAQPLRGVVDQAERDAILKTLDECNGNKRQAAKRLGIPRSVLYTKLKKIAGGWDSNPRDKA